MNKEQNHSFRFTISIQYFLYFGIMGITLPYFNLYCYHLDFSGSQIGILSALRSLATVLFSLIWGRLADRFQTRRPIYIICNFISTALWVFFLYTTDFHGMIVVTIGYVIFHAPIISFLEAFTMDVLGTEKKSYGRVRVWGTLSFIAVSIILGKAIELYSVKIILILILAGSFLQAIFSLKIPDIAPAHPAHRSRVPMSEPRNSNPVPIFLFCAFLMLVSHGAYYGFFSIHLENLGYKASFIGMAWALASISEILVMINSDKIFRRFSLEKVLVFSFIVAACRWFALFFVSSPVLILFSQMTHAATYGTFHIASILYIDSLTPDKSKTTGQAVNNAVTYGLGMMIGFFANGYLYEHTSSFTLFLASGFVALAGGVILSLFYWKSD